MTANVWSELNNHAIRNTRPTSEEYNDLSVKSGKPVTTLARVLDKLTLADFYETEAQYGDTRTHLSKAKSRFAEACRLWDA